MDIMWAIAFYLLGNLTAILLIGLCRCAAESGSLEADIYQDEHASQFKEDKS